MDMLNFDIFSLCLGTGICLKIFNCFILFNLPGLQWKKHFHFAASKNLQVSNAQGCNLSYIYGFDRIE